SQHSAVALVEVELGLGLGHVDRGAIRLRVVLRRAKSAGKLVGVLVVGFDEDVFAAGNRNVGIRRRAGRTRGATGQRRGQRVLRGGLLEQQVTAEAQRHDQQRTENDQGRTQCVNTNGSSSRSNSRSLVAIDVEQFQDDQVLHVDQ